MSGSGKSRRFLLGYNTSGFSRTPDLLEIVDAVADLGFEAIEVSFDPAHLHPSHHTSGFAQKVRRRCLRRNLAIATGAGGRGALGDRPHLPSWLSDDPEERQARLRFLEEAVVLTAWLESPVMVFHSGPRPARVPPARARAYLEEGLEALLAAAQAAGVCPALEFHPSMFVDTLAAYGRVARKFPKLSLALDIGHLRCNWRGKLADGIRKAAGQTIHVHLEDIRGRVHRHLPIGEGTLPFDEAFSTLKETGFSGICAAEFHSREIATDERTLAENTFRHLSPLL